MHSTPIWSGPLNSRTMMPGFSSFLLISKETFRSSARFQGRKPRLFTDASSPGNPSGPRRAFSYGRRFAFIWKLTNHSNAGAERVEEGVSPPGWQDRGRPLIDEFVRLGEETCVLALGRRGEFFYGHKEIDVAILLIFLNREMMQQRQLFGDFFLSKFPIAHKSSVAKGESARESRCIRTAAS